MYNKDSLMRYIELKKQYEKQFIGKEQYELYPRIWFKIDDYDVLSDYLEEAISKNVVLLELNSIHNLEMEDLDNRLRNTLEQGIKMRKDKHFK